MLAWVLLCTGPRAHAEEPFADRELYERELIEAALSRLDLEPEPDPAGKRIERVAVVRFPIVRPLDPGQRWLHRTYVPVVLEYANLLHVVTREHIIRQELLFADGQVYDEALVRESARNLRALPLIFSTVRIVTARGSSPDRVVVVVITKDLWSIRLNSNGNFGGGVFNYFYMTPSEQNFLGYNQRLSLHFYLDRDTYAIGQAYRVPRLLGSRIQVEEDAAVRINHRRGGTEGGYGSLLFQRPLFSLSTRWGFFVDGRFDLGIDRHYQGADYRLWKVDDEATGASWILPEIYAHQHFAARAIGQAAFGERFRTVLSAGYSMRSYTYELTDGMALLPEPVRDVFRASIMPLDEQYGSLVAGVEFFEARYRRFQNIQTLGLTEDFRLGPRALGELGWAEPVFGFSQEHLRLYVELGWRECFSGDIVSARLVGSIRYMPEHGIEQAHTDWIDRYAEIELENVSPSLWDLGRLFVRLRYVYSQYSRARTRYSLGGENTLRGFVSGFRAGERLLNVNVEFRSRPWVFDTIHLGFVVFYDGGDAYGFTAERDFSYHQSAGLGLRGIFPALDRWTTRLDIGIPLGADFHSHVIDWVTIAFLQAF
ncbi:MAG: BamA/TamA family outer membrane protein [Deltaproteobacteria bacterium]|nr:BamA/TamA family outer membrane protein [Deltaproteobacteria bacterium]